MLFYLIYVSTATAPVQEAELQTLLRTCRQKNRRLDVTGMLLYRGGQFMQMLEGKQKTVLSLYETIYADARHTDIVVLEQGTLPHRSFATWSMGFCNMDHEGVLPAFDEYLEQYLLSTNDFHDVAREARALLLSFATMYRQ